MSKLVLVFLFLTGFSSCVFTTKSKPSIEEINHEEAQDAMLKADRDFSAASEKEGMKKAFLNYIADDAVLLRPGYLPIVEGDVVKFLTSQEDTSFVMTWKPEGAHLSKSNDLGYTYGVYEIKLKEKDSVINGTYLSIWQKQADGKWKLVLDTGNQGADNSVQ